MSVLAIIPARGGSKGIPGKNLALCGGRPLVDWTIEAALGAQRVDAVVLSSDSEEILGRAPRSPKMWNWSRPAELAQDTSPTELAIADVLDHVMPYDVIALLQPTSPLRTAEHIDQAIALFEESGADSLVSVVPSHAYLWDGAGRPLYAERRRRQEMEQYEENGAIYLFTMEHWRRTGDRLGGRVQLFVMGEEHRLQIDSRLDLALTSFMRAEAAIERADSRSAVPA